MKKADTRYWRIRLDLQALLNKPLPGGRGYQVDLDNNIHRLAAELAAYQPPER